MDQAVDELRLADQAGDRGEHLQVIASLLARDQHDDQVDPLVGHRSLVADARPASADGEDVAPAHLDPHVRQRHAEAQVGGHGALAGEQSLEQRLALQVGELRQRYGEKLLQRSLQVNAAQVDDPVPGDDFVEPHDGIPARLVLPLQSALLDLVDEAEGEDEDEEQNGAEDRYVLVRGIRGR